MMVLKFIAWITMAIVFPWFLATGGIIKGIVVIASIGILLIPEEQYGFTGSANNYDQR